MTEPTKPIRTEEIRNHLKKIRELSKTSDREFLLAIKELLLLYLAVCSHCTNDPLNDVQHLVFEIDDDLFKINKKIEETKP